VKRAVACLAASLALALVLGGCGGDGDDVAPEAVAADSAATTANAVAPEGFDAIDASGPGEAAALAALPDVLEQAKQMRESSGVEWPDLTGVEPRLTAHVLAVDMNGQSALFEVRADGVAHNLYAYQRAFDAASLVWTPTAESSGTRAVAQSDPEKAAAAAVDAAMRDSFPEGAYSVGVYGYRFVYLAGDTTLLAVEISADGTLISVGD
jgi:hypothetical protein